MAKNTSTVKLVLKGPCAERPPSILRGQNLLRWFVTNATSDLRPPAFCGHSHCAKGVASQDRFDLYRQIKLIYITREQCATDEHLLPFLKSFLLPYFPLYHGVVYREEKGLR